MVDEVINLQNMEPSVTVDQNDGTSFARTVTLTGSAHDGFSGPYFNDYDSWLQQFGDIKRVEIQPPGTTDWKQATDTSGANGEVTMNNWPFKTWSFEWDMGADVEKDVTFRIKSHDGLDESIVSTRVFKLNINPPTINVDTPLDGSTHDGQEVLFTGTANDAYNGIQGSDIRDIWFSVEGPNNYSGNYPASAGGGSVWSDTWNFSSLPTGYYTFTIWASDANYCHEVVDICDPEVLTIYIDNDNRIPILQVSEPLPMASVRASEETVISGVARDNDGQVTRVEISIYDLAAGYELNDGPDPITSFQPNGAWMTYWDTSDLIHDQQYEVRVKAYDGVNYSLTETVRITIDNPADADNIKPVFNSTGWIETITIFCDERSSAFDKCGGGVEINLLDYFSDPDGVGPETEHMNFVIYDNPSTAEDDDYDSHVTWIPGGKVIYDPMTSMATTTSEISEWSMQGVVFEARDIHDSSNYSYAVNFIVKGVEFTAQRVDEGSVEFGDSAVFSGTGLPDSVVTARLVEGRLRLNDTIVGQDGLWSMEITSAVLDNDGHL